MHFILKSFSQVKYLGRASEIEKLDGSECVERLGAIFLRFFFFITIDLEIANCMSSYMVILFCLVNNQVAPSADGTGCFCLFHSPVAFSRFAERWLSTVI